MVPMEARGALLWGAEVKPGTKNAYKLDIDEDSIAVLTGVCCDGKAEKGFRASVVIQTADGAEEGESKEVVVACVSQGASENVQLEIPLYPGDKIISRTTGKAKLHVFGSVAPLEEDLGDVMDPDYAERLAQFQPAMRLNGDLSDDEDEEEEEDADKPTIEEMEEDSEEAEEDDDESSNDDEDQLEQLLKDRFKGRVGKKDSETGAKKQKTKTPTPPTSPKKGKRKLSVGSDGEQTKKQKNGSEDSAKPTKEKFLASMKKWVAAEGTKDLKVQEIGGKIVAEYKIGFKKLGFGGKITDFLKKSGLFNVEKGVVSLK